MGYLANVYQALGQISKAIECYERSLIIRKEVGDRRGEAIDLNNLGHLHKEQSNNSQARQYLEQALEIFQEIQSPHADTSRHLLAELEKIENAQSC